MTNLTHFTYKAIGEELSYETLSSTERFGPITAFLEDNCPKLQHLQIKLSPQIKNDGISALHASFANIILAKANLETPKTFVSLDFKYCGQHPFRSLEFDDELADRLVGWKRLAPGEYQSFISKR